MADVESSSNAEPGGDRAERSGRAAIAAQACETCRSRKSRCDEQRPKCSLCRRLDVPCVYREPRPTKKDQTTSHILQTIQRVEEKLDNLLRSQRRSLSFAEGAAPPTPIFTPEEHGSDHQPLQGLPSLAQAIPTFEESNPKRYERLKGAHSVLMWPAIKTLIESVGGDQLGPILRAGTSWFMKQELEKHPEPLPCDVGLRSIPLYSYGEPGTPGRVSFPDLTEELMIRYADEYFSTFNMLYPVLDYDEYMDDILPLVVKEGFGDGCMSSLIALLVSTLGKVAWEGVHGRPITTKDGLVSGIRGGTSDKPPALDIFNEVRRRSGFVLSQCNLQNAQVLLLTAIYYESCSRHVDFWRTAVTASGAIKAMLRLPVEWDTHSGDMIKRVYWSCNIIEAWYHLDLDLPETGIADLQDIVALPLFSGRNDPTNTLGLEEAKYQYNFLGMISIRKLIRRVIETIYESSAGGPKEGYASFPSAVIKELAHQLEEWRSLLPEPLQWSDASRTQYRFYDPKSSQSRLTGFSSTHLSSTQTPISQPLNADIITSQLRARYYYARFMIYRPYLYKAVHYPDLMTPDDINCCVSCLQSCILWPIAMSPPKDKKRLIPNIYVWTQSFSSFLLVFRMARDHQLLRQICETHLSMPDIEESIAMMIEWMEDMKQVDGVAAWCWNIAQPLYFGFGSRRSSTTDSTMMEM